MPIRLTQLPRVKQLFESSQQSLDEPNVDALMQDMIDDASADAEVRCVRKFAESSYTRYLDGDGSDTLFLGQGPLVSVTSVERVEYSTNPTTGARVETPETVPAGDYLMEGLRADGCLGEGILRMRCGSWCRGHRNYKVQFTAGWLITFGGGVDEVPLGLARAVTSRVAALWNLRDLDGMTSRDSGDISRVASLVENRERAWDVSLAPYRLMRAG